MHGVERLKLWSWLSFRKNYATVSPAGFLTDAAKICALVKEEEGLIKVIEITLICEIIVSPL